ncbi:carboxyltransferase domain-containing protein (plasmid) [Rhizobium grahamii]|uniref:Carboxyltransferase domain-containing protein n=1 Tax=Rhizobium grahamii TaxID=1120045 RepID=A0A5Q0CFC8_9HYPH|nr:MULTISPECIES: carboxyltransferase domain-containing protein [Rhizobium]QFY62518.1 carboxyltransferase domain-containing protein [Rhizobium grahamii]QFY64015.1 carboxyltransferase domain-containing protein [Rhizobium grahamii]QRM52741.1 carboxyltransferase domain-containing protein [Rhizobium sp. BG6]
MVDRARILPAGSDAFLVELEDLDATLSLMDSLLARQPVGVLELIPGARTVMVRFDPFSTSRLELTDFIRGLDLSRGSARAGKSIDIPVVYDGEDLQDVADLLGWSIDELVRRHTEATYTVAFTGFAPGFAYMTCDDPEIEVPRRKSPRVKIPAGSVAIAGKFGGIYPSDSPGGWQLLGRTPLAMWDTTRNPAALLSPGDTVRFRRAEAGTHTTRAAKVAPPVPAISAPVMTVLRSDRPASYQDLGRPNVASQGVARSGALDRDALLSANRCVGNARDAAAIEIAFGGLGVRADMPVTVAVTGARCPLNIRTADGREIPAPFALPFALDAGDELTLGMPTDGMVSYLALRGCYAVAPVLGSAATDILAKIGPAQIEAGSVLGTAGSASSAVDPWGRALRHLPTSKEIVTLDVVLGPRFDWFTSKGAETFCSQEWRVTPQSSRVGIRLSGQEAIERSISAELPSEGTLQGAIQVPADGQPVLFLADHPVTGGYPVIASVAEHHLDLAGQIPIGARIRFRPITPFDGEAIELNARGAV